MARPRLNQRKWNAMKGAVTKTGESINNEEAQNRILKELGIKNSVLKELGVEIR